MERRRLEAEEITSRLDYLNDWRAQDERLTKRLTFANFAEALEFVNAVGVIAERFDHHPDVKFGWGYAEIELTTHDRGGLTDFDFAVAKEIDMIGIES